MILFTDGIPNRPSNESSGKSLARAQARRAKNLGIPVYTIGLSQNPDIIAEQDRLLSDSRSSYPEGIAKLSANGAVYVRVNNSADLNKAFQTIARSLVVLQQ